MAKKQNVNKGLVQVGPKLWAVDCYVNGKRVRRTVGSHNGARVYLEKLKTTAKEKKHVPELHRKKVTFRELAEEYTQYADLHHRRKGDDLPRLKTWIDAFGELEPEEIRPAQVETVLERLKGEGKAPATLARRLVVLKAVLNRAVRHEQIIRNPVSIVRPPKANNVMVRNLADGQEAKLFEALPSRLHPLVTVALHTGCRQGELIKLRWEDVDFSSGTFLLRDTKAGESRRVRMNSKVLGVLSSLPGRENTERAVFTDTNGNPIDSRNLRRDFEMAVRKAKIGEFRFHDLRHTFASRLAMNGANDRTLMALGGWKSPRMLERYAHLGPTHLMQALEGLVSKSRFEGVPERSTDAKTDTQAEVKKADHVTT